jgi:hypothetical protein
MANCTLCQKPIVLVPSAAERAAKYGGTASDYTKIFTTHNHCLIAKRNEDTRELIARNTAAAKAKRVTYPTTIR